jgi:GTPase SAR1 family protein
VTDCHNAFAIPIHREPYGDETRVEVAWTDDSPLSPWRVDGHMRLFAPVDDLERQLSKFDEGLKPENLRNANGGTGHLVVVSGRVGSGKTTLIHRCVHRLIRRLQLHDDSQDDSQDDTRNAPLEWGEVPLPPDVKVVEVAGTANSDSTLTEQDGEPAGIKEINRRIYERALKILQHDAHFEAASVLPGHADLYSQDLGECYRALSRLLVDQDLTALIIVPNIPWWDRKLTRRFLRSCAGYSQRGIVFFVESTNSLLPEIMQEAFDEQEKRKITHLTIGRLRELDGHKFIKRRLDNRTFTDIGIADDVIDNYRAPNSGCVRDLQLIFHGVAEKAWQDGVGVIDMALVREYEAHRIAQQDSDMRRPRPPGREPDE